MRLQMPPSSTPFTNRWPTIKVNGLRGQLSKIENRLPSILYKFKRRMCKEILCCERRIPPPFRSSRERKIFTTCNLPGERILRSFLRLAAFVGFYEALLGCSRVESILQLFTYVYLVTRERVQCSNNRRTYAGIINESPPLKTGR